jgi:hypothetical protein
MEMIRTGPDMGCQARATAEVLGFSEIKKILNHLPIPE